MDILYMYINLLGWGALAFSSVLCHKGAIRCHGTVLVGRDSGTRSDRAVQVARGSTAGRERLTAGREGGRAADRENGWTGGRAGDRTGEGPDGRTAG